MTASLIGSLIGVFTSMLPRIFEIFQAKQDARHEIELYKIQFEYRKLAGDIAVDLGEQELEQTSRIADMREQNAALKHDAEVLSKASKWVSSYAALVRPNITYLLVGEIVMLTIFTGIGWISLEWYRAIWNEGTQGIFSTIIMFYFGNRTFNRQGRQT